MNEETLMKIAIAKAIEGVRKGQAPFGACISKDGEVISAAYNSVWQDIDITAHAEINAIRDACKNLNTIDLSGYTIYSTTEPCPMCFSAICWACISGIVFGSTIEDARELGFKEMLISNEQMKTLSLSNIEIRGGFLKEECLKVFEEWMLPPGRRTY